MDCALPILTSARTSPTCIWMDAGAVAFRLCDRGFECDHCPFDAAMLEFLQHRMRIRKQIRRIRRPGGGRAI